MSSFYRTHPHSQCSLSTGFSRRTLAACSQKKGEVSLSSFVIRRDAPSCATAKIPPFASLQEGGCSRRLEQFLPGTGGKDLIQFAFGQMFIIIPNKNSNLCWSTHTSPNRHQKQALSIIISLFRTFWVWVGVQGGDIYFPLVLYFNNRRIMGKQDKKKQFAQASKPSKHKQIAQPAPKTTKETKPPKPAGKQLFQIINETEGADDPFAALPFEDEQEEVEVKGAKSSKNKFKKQKKEATPEQSEEEEPVFEEGQEQEIDDDFDVEGQEDEGEQQNEEDQEELPGDHEGEDFHEQDHDEDEQHQDQQGENGMDEQGNDEQVDCDAPPLQQQQNDNEPVDISVVNLQIQETINILMNIGRLGEGKPRKHYIQQLRALLHKYYGYNFELIDHFLNFLNPAELVQFFEANETQRPLTIRTNTLKTRRKQLAQSLIQRGANLDPLAEWSKVGIKIYESKVPIGATPEYLAGHYMLQSASSFLPVLALDPQVGERVLDMASAPGGKTTYIAQIMKNTGCIFANDLKEERLKALKFNLYRLGITNTVVTCRDGRKYPLIFPGSFDRVLLDAPCTGLGIISKDHSIKANRLLLDIYKNSHIQKQLILAAIDCARVGGTIVYSTCSVSPLENEEVVNYALKKRHIKIVETDVEVGEEGLIKFVDKRYHVDLRKTRRIYPHVHNMDGFYVAKLVKVGKGVKLGEEKDKQEQQ